MDKNQIGTGTRSTKEIEQEKTEWLEKQNQTFDIRTRTST